MALNLFLLNLNLSSVGTSAKAPDTIEEISLLLRRLNNRTTSRDQAYFIAN